MVSGNRQAMDGVPVPPVPPTQGPAMMGQPSMGPGPSNDGVMGMPGEPSDLASLFQGYTSGTTSREELVAALSGRAQGPEGIRTLLTELQGSSPPLPGGALPPDHQELVELLNGTYGLSREDAMALVSDITGGGPVPMGPEMGGGMPPGGPPMGGPPMPPMGGGGPPGGGAVPGPSRGGGMPL